MILVIMAAGMGSRFGGLKQIEPIGPNGEFIIDYSIYDALRCGFDKVVFIIKKENYEIFKETIGKRIEKHIKVEYAFQSNDILPSNIREERIKPLGTAQAVLCAKEYVNENFAVLNADDFYGYDAFRVVSEFLKENKNENKYSLIAYNMKNTITNNGSVKRGICESKDNYLTNLIESKVEKVDNKYICFPLNGRESFEIKGDNLVSMNFFGFTIKLFNYLEEGLKTFLNKNDLLKDEYLLPDLICKHINDKSILVEVLNTSAVWHGMTYKEDKELLVHEINNLIKSGIYPENLWK